MVAIFTSREYRLNAGEQASCRVEAGTHMRMAGAPGARLWLTRAGDRRDHWLMAGQCLELAEGGEWWLSNEGETLLVLHLCRAETPPPGLIAGLAARLRRPHRIAAEAACGAAQA